MLILVITTFYLAASILTVNANGENCQLGQFQCDNSNCVSAFYLCDGDNDCGDESDELNCTNCNRGAVYCTNIGKCLHNKYKCNGEDDCGDWSDEQNCPNTGSTVSCDVKTIHILHAEHMSCNTDDKMPYRGILSVKCHEGYVLDGSNNLTCQSHGKWSTPPQCIRGCSAPKKRSHATLFNWKEMYTVDSQVIFICDDGYVTGKQKKTHSHLTCTLNGEWIPENAACLLEEKYTTGTMEIEAKASINLPCITNKDDQQEQQNDTDISYLWMKNSQDIASTNMDYSIDDNGTLSITNMSEGAVGQYICFQKGQYIIPASVEFDLKLKPEACPQSGNKTEQVTFYEGTSAVLTCPHTSSDHEFKWFKDGQPYYVRDDQTLFSDGSLHTKNLKYLDQGTYTCNMRKKETLCERNHTTEVKIITTTLSICGNVDPEYPHPWAVSLLQKGEYTPFCYGAIIHKNWIVTAAHCLAAFNRKRNVVVRLGYHTQQDSHEHEHDSSNLEIHSVKIHPKFSWHIRINNIALAQLKNPVHFTRSVRPICIMETDPFTKFCDRQVHLLNGTVVGWGPLETDYNEISTLTTESMTTVSTRDTCFDGCQICFEKIMCSAKTNGTATTFAGDAGSPFEVLWKKQRYLLGIFSWGERVTLLGEFDYFTKITPYVSWMKRFFKKTEIEPM